MYKNEGLMGLINLGNTCYMNSTLQFLSHTYIDMDIIEELKKNIHRDNITASYYNFLKHKWLSNKDVFKPTELKHSISKFNKTFVGNEQQDSHELLLFLLDNLEKNNLFIKNNFQGSFISTLNCPLCKYQSKTKQPFYTLNLDISHSTNLNDCLNHYLNSEKLDNKNCWRCTKCNQEVNAEKTIKINKYPKNLIIVLKRFSYYRIGKRCNKQISFPLMFKNNTYQLTSIINHYGSYNYGHYTAIGKSPLNGRWIHYNDDKVSYINYESDEQGLTKFGISAYILLYEKVI